MQAEECKELVEKREAKSKGSKMRKKREGYTQAKAWLDEAEARKRRMQTQNEHDMRQRKVEIEKTEVEGPNSESTQPSWSPWEGYWRVRQPGTLSFYWGTSTLTWAVTVLPGGV